MEGRVRAEEQNSVAIKVGEGVDEWTLRTGEECMQRSNINTANVKASRWGPLVDGDWHAVCQAIYKGVGGAE